MIMASRQAPDKTIYTFYSEKEDVILSKTEMEIIQEEYKKQQRRNNQDE